MKRFSEFAKGIYETCDYNIFNFALIIVVIFSVVHFILVLYFAKNNLRKTVKNVRIPGGVTFFFLNVTSWDIQF